MIRYQFPGAEIIKSHLSSDPFLLNKRFVFSGLTSQVIALAAERFADVNLREISLKRQIILLANEVDQSIIQDGILPFPQGGFSSQEWDCIRSKIENSLKACATT